jgi:hypothetical protein
MQVQFPSLLERDGRVRPGAAKRIADEIIKSLTPL